MAGEEKSKQIYELKRQLKFLKGIRGSGTELISLYITPNSAVFDASNKLKEEYGQAGNIKSKQTRTNVQEALMKIIQHLKTFRTAPPNGLAIFCGNISREPGRPDIRLFALEPHEPLRAAFYRCDSTFVLEPLEEIISIKDTYGLIVMDGREATIATLRGKSTVILRRLHSTAHAKIRKGGQSARRFERLIEESIELYYKRIGAAMDEIFVGMPNLRGIIVGGPGPAKEDFVKMSPFNYQLKVLGVLDTGYTEEYGVKELTDKSDSIIMEQETIREKKLVDSFVRQWCRAGSLHTARRKCGRHSGRGRSRCSWFRRGSTGSASPTSARSAGKKSKSSAGARRSSTTTAAGRCGPSRMSRSRESCSSLRRSVG